MRIPLYHRKGLVSGEVCNLDRIVSRHRKVGREAVSQIVEAKVLNLGLPKCGVPALSPRAVLFALSRSRYDEVGYRRIPNLLLFGSGVLQRFKRNIRILFSLRKPLRVRK